jgi:DNA-binding response OmpR family regulator
LATDNKILVIDDEVQIRRLLEITLSLHGYKVSEASTAKEGKITAASHNPALISLDLRLPGSGCRFSSPSQRAITAVARQLPNTFTDVRAISINSSMPRMI